MKLNVWLYTDDGYCAASCYICANTIDDLLKQLDKLSENGYYTYQICDGSNSRVRPKKKRGKNE